MTCTEGDKKRMSRGRVTTVTPGWGRQACDLRVVEGESIEVELDLNASGNVPFIVKKRAGFAGRGGRWIVGGDDAGAVREKQYKKARLREALLARVISRSSKVQPSASIK